MIINEAFAKKYWPKADPIGQRIEIGKEMGPDFAENPREVVGIIGDVKEGGLGNPAPEVMYIPLAQLKDSFTALNNKTVPMTWVVKTAVSPLTLSAAVRKQVSEADGQLAVAHERSLDQVVAEATARENFNMTLLSVFAGIGCCWRRSGSMACCRTRSSSARRRSEYAWPSVHKAPTFYGWW